MCVFTVRTAVILCLLDLEGTWFYWTNYRSVFILGFLQPYHKNVVDFDDCC